MAEFTQINVITDAGKAAISNAILTETSVDLTEFAVGSGDISAIGDLEAQTALVNEEHRGAITASEVDPQVPGIVTVEFNVPAPIGGFTMTEWGLFDAAGNLFAIGNYPASFKATDTTDATVRVRLVIGNTDVINLVIDPTVAIASRKYVDDKILAAHGSVVIYGALFGVAVTDGDAVRYDIANQQYELAIADGTENNLAEGIADVTNAQVVKFGATRPGLIAGLTPENRYFLSDTTAGEMVTAEPSDSIKMGHAFSTNVFFVDIDTGRASDIAHGQCRLEKSGANLVLSPFSGNRLIIDGVGVTIPGAGVSLAPDGLIADTTYYIYAYLNAGVLTLEASETGHSKHSDGVEIQTGDQTRTLVGMARTVAGPAWSDTAAARFVLSYFNRKPVFGQNSFSTQHTTGSTADIELHSEIRVEFLTWGDFDGQTHGMTANNGAYFNATQVSIDGIDDPNFKVIGQTPTSPYRTTMFARTLKLVAEGYHYATLLGSVSGGVGSWFAADTSQDTITTIVVRVEG